MATLAETKTAADTVFDALWTKLVTAEDSYSTKRSKYFQLLSTNDVPEGLDAIFAKRNPSDEKFSSDVVLAFATKLPFRIEVFSREEASGTGFTAHVWINYKSDVHHRSKSVGSGKTVAWHKYTEF